MLVYNLQSESYGIVSVETVKEAMEVLKSQPFDLVLLDINLPSIFILILQQKCPRNVTD